MRRIEEKKKLNGGKLPSSDSMSRVSSLSDIDGNNSESEIDVVGEEASTGSGCGHDEQEQEMDLSVAPSRGCQDKMAPEGQNGIKPVLVRSAFSIESLLEAPKVPRGRRPNSKYPRVQASKSMNPLSLGMYPLYPITQPVGFQVERPPTPSTPSSTPDDPSPEPLRRFSSPSSLRTNQKPQPRSGLAHTAQSRSETHEGDGQDSRHLHNSSTDSEGTLGCAPLSPLKKSDRLVPASKCEILVLPGAHNRKCITPPYVKCVPEDPEVKRSSSNPTFGSFSDTDDSCGQFYALDCSLKGPAEVRV